MISRAGVPLRLSGGKVVGLFEGDTATFPVKRSRHYFRHVGGYTLDAEVVRRLPEACARVVFDDRETGLRFRVNLLDFLASAVRVEFGFGEKLCAPDSIYEPLESPQPALFPLPAPTIPTRQARAPHG
ncbi:MAG: hypothetical protein PHU21_07480 [Elusimicrobia bacterium]|nr:hypothetical protein [Elusimicrobiota bacterium]